MSDVVAGSSEIGSKMKDLKFHDHDNDRQRKTRTPPPPIVTSTTDTSALTLTPTRNEADDAIAAPTTPESANNHLPPPLGFKRVLSSPPTYDVSKPPPTRPNNSNKFSVNTLPSIPHSPAPHHHQGHHHPHSTLTPVTRNTFNGGNSGGVGGIDDKVDRRRNDFGDVVDRSPLGAYVVSPEDFLSTLAMPDADDDDDDKDVKINAAARNLPDDIYLTSSSDDHVHPTPLKPNSRPAPSPRARSVGNLDSYHLSFSSSRSPHESPIPEITTAATPTTPNDDDDVGDEDLVNVSAPAEFFETTLGLNSTEHDRRRRSPPFLRDLRDHGNNNTTIPSLQYQPSRRDDSLTDVGGVNRNAEGLKSIFTTRTKTTNTSASASTTTATANNNNAPSSSSSSVTKQIFSPVPVELLNRIPSIRMANRLGNDDQTASFTDGEYSWELDDDSIHQHRPLVLPGANVVDPANAVVDPEADTAAAVGEDNDDDGSLVTALDDDNKDNKVVVVSSSSSSRRRDGSRALEWLQEVQYGSENRVGEAASSKFLTKGVSGNVAGRSSNGGVSGSSSSSRGVVVRSVVRHNSDDVVQGTPSPVSAANKPGQTLRMNLAGNKGIVPQSADRGMMKRSLIYH